MKNIIDYVQEFGNTTFAQSPFNEVDALILSQLTYFQWENLEIDLSKKMISFKSLQQNILDLVEHTTFFEENMKLYFAMVDSKRFENMNCGYFRYILNKEKDEQFSAITFECEEGFYDIAFRGTDSTLIGWKEDFNLSFSIHVTGQVSALKYVEMMQQQNKKYRLMGHSKGGNLATYCGCMLKNPTNLCHIYNFDGPGFLPGTMDSNRIYLIYSKYVPEESIIGLIMQESDHYTIINARKKYFNQHNIYNWSIDGSSFEKADKLDPLAIYIQRSANRWLLHASIEKRQVFFDTIFELLNKQGMDSFKEFKFQDIWSILKDYKDIDDDMKKVMTDLIKLLVTSNYEQSKEMIEDYIDTKRKKE